MVIKAFTDAVERILELHKIHTITKEVVEVVRVGLFEGKFEMVSRDISTRIP